MPPPTAGDIRENLRLHVDRLAGLIGPRELSRPTMINAAIGYVSNQWQAMEYEVRREAFDASGDTATNLVIETPGAKRPEQIIVLGAHYDTVPDTPGADDNASAVAVMLEVSRLLQGHVARRTLRCVAFACEEATPLPPGCRGSRHHATQAKLRDERIMGMLCLEMVGYFCAEPNSQQIPPSIPRVLHGFFPKRGDFLAAVGNLASWKLSWAFRRGFKRGTRLPLFSICLPESIREIRRSDNSSFWDQGYPALMLTDTSYLRNPHYHEPTDLPDTLDYDAMTQVTLGVAAAVKRLVG